MSGVKGKSGRHKALTTLINEAIDDISQDLPELFGALKAKALEGDREAAVYLIDRVLGKPKQQTDIDLKGGLELTAYQTVELMQILTQKQRELESPRLIEEGKDAVKQIQE